MSADAAITALIQGYLVQTQKNSLWCIRELQCSTKPNDCTFNSRRWRNFLRVYSKVVGFSTRIEIGPVVELTQTSLQGAFDFGAEGYVRETSHSCWERGPNSADWRRRRTCIFDALVLAGTAATSSHIDRGKAARIVNSGRGGPSAIFTLKAVPNRPSTFECFHAPSSAPNAAEGLANLHRRRLICNLISN